MRIALGILIAALPIGGCASVPDDGSGWRGTLRPAVEPLELVEARPFAASNQAEFSLPSYEIFLNSHEAVALEFIVTPKPGPDGQARFVAERIEGAKPLTTHWLSIDASGDLVAQRMADHRRRLVTVFDPPLVLYPASLSPEQPHEQSLEFRIHPASNPKKLKDRGDARSVIELIGVQPVLIGEREINAYLVRTTLDIEFGAATVHREMDQWFAPGVGLIAESFDERIKILGLPADRTRKTMRAITLREDKPSL